MAVRWDINLGTVIPITLTMVVGIGIPLIVWGSNINSRLDVMGQQISSSENFRSSRTAATDKNFVDILSLIREQQTSTAKLSSESINLTYRMGQLEATASENNKNLNSRMDRLSESLIGSVQTLRDLVGGLGTQIQLANQKIDALDVPRSPTRRMP